MATISISPSPHGIGGTMATRRLALAENSNLGNSPYARPAVTPVKRTRSYSNAGENTPPNKRPNLDEKLAPKTPTRKLAPARVERKAQAEKQIVGRAIKQERGEADNQSLETVLQWQRHYRKMFPSYVFYFENIPEDTRRRCVKGIESLGAREVKFFSKDVTHIITTRSVPLQDDSSQETENNVKHMVTAQSEYQHLKTINPSLLDRSADVVSEIPKGKFNFDLASLRKGVVPLSDANARRPTASKVDILQKAKELGIKIWQLEKLWRVLKTIFDNSQSHESHNARGNPAAQIKAVKQVDLSQMIKNEQIHERGDREINAGPAEMITLSGPYVYVRDMNEKTKPILVRMYPKVDKKEDGEWPQFRSASIGKCPFVEEDVQSRRVKEYREEKTKRITETKTKPQPAAQMRITRTMMQPPVARVARMESGKTSIPARQAYQLPPPPGKNDSTFTNGKDGHCRMPGVRFIGGEPVASGVQPSNITSAIRSQMISSTAAGPGAKAGTSKEIHDLQRKALERNTHGLRQSQRMTDIAGHYGRASESSIRATTREQVTIDEEDEDDAQQTTSKGSGRSKDHAPVKEEKPGYCENCREKFNDFEQHTLGRKHKKFATDANNWRDLDRLLARLVRPLKSDLESGDDEE